MTGEQWEIWYYRLKPWTDSMFTLPEGWEPFAMLPPKEIVLRRRIDSKDKER